MLKCSWHWLACAVGEIKKIASRLAVIIRLIVPSYGFENHCLVLTYSFEKLVLRITNHADCKVPMSSEGIALTERLYRQFSGRDIDFMFILDDSENEPRVGKKVDALLNVGTVGP